MRHRDRYDDSTFAVPEAIVGIVDGHMPRLLRDRVPSAMLRYWLYTGARFSADEAFGGGLLTKVVEPDALEEATAKILRELRASSASAITMYKQTLNETRQLSSMHDAYTTMLGEDARTRLIAFSDRSKRSRSDKNRHGTFEVSVFLDFLRSREREYGDREALRVDGVARGYDELLATTLALAGGLGRPESAPTIT